MSKQDKDNLLPTLKSIIESNEETEKDLFEDDDIAYMNKQYKTSGVNMFFSAVYLVFLILTLFLSSIALFTKRSALLLKPSFETGHLVSSNNQKMFTLFNGLKVAFIDTNETITSAISLVVQAGTGDEEYKGIAKLTQILFDYKLKLNPTFISVYSSITHDKTYYTIEIDNSTILESLEYMSNIIIEPEIEIEDIEKAIKQVDYENKYNTIDNNREFIENELLYYYYHEIDNYSKNQFKQLILSDDLNKTQNETLNYIDTLYYANRMSISIVVSGQLNNITFQQKTFSILSHFRISEKNNEEYEPDSFNDKDSKFDTLGDDNSKIYWYQSDQNTISIYYLNNTFNKQFYNYFEYTLNTYGEFYLFNEKESFIKSIEAFHIKVNSMYEALGLRVILFKKSAQKLMKIIQGLLAYVDKLCSDLEKDFALAKSYKEIKEINKQKILFNEKTYSSAYLAYVFANRMFVKKEEDSVKNNLQQLPKVIIIGNDKFNNNAFEVFDFSKDKLTIPKELEENDYSYTIEDIKLKQDEENKYISMYEEKQDAENTQGNKQGIYIFESTKIKVIHKEMNIDYYLPKTKMLFELSPNLFNNEDNATEYFTMLVYVSYLKQSIKMLLSEGLSAGNDVSIQYNNGKSIMLSIFGYNDKIERIAKEVFQIVFDYNVRSNDDLNKLNETVWDTIIKQNKSHLYSKADDYFYYFTEERYVDIYNLNYSQLNIFSISENITHLAQKNNLLKEMKGIVYSTGIGERLKDAIKERLKKQITNKTSIPLKRIGETSEVIIKTIHNKNKEQYSSMVSNYTLFGKSTDKKEYVMTWILEEFMRDKLIEMKYEDYIFIKRIISNDNIWLNFAIESFNKTNAEQLNRELNNIITKLRNEMNNCSMFNCNIVKKYKARYKAKSHADYHNIKKQAETELNKADFKDNDIDLNEVFSDIFTKDLLDIFTEKLFTKPYILSIRLLNKNSQ